MSAVQREAERLSVLLVDDRPDNTLTLEAVLGSEDIECVHAHSGREALRLLEEKEIALVLMDIRMPDLNGFAVASQMQGNLRSRATPVIFITAYSRDIELELCGYRAGGIDVLYKPINTALLISKVQAVLEADRARRALAAVCKQLEQTTAYFQAILETAAEGVVVVSPTGVIRFANRGAGALLGCAPETLEGRPFATLFSATRPPTNEDDAEETDAWGLQTYLQALRTAGAFRLSDTRIYREDHRPVPVAMSGAPLPPPHHGIVLVFQDITANKQLQEKLVTQANTDALTGLANRSGFMHAVHSALARVERSHQSLALLFIDLDGFKRINDSFGHEVGDSLLREVAHRLRKCMRPYDVLARVGGDEFTAILDTLSAPEEAARIAEKILDILASGHDLSGVNLSVGASIGIASYPECGSTPEGLVRAADMAMYQAKSEGKNQYRFFTPAMNGRARVRLMLEESLKKAVSERQFLLHYQPQVDTASGGIRGYEALLRWQHPEAGIVSPALFMPLLEETGLVTRLGGWILRAVAEQCVIWRQTLNFRGRVSVNLSAKQFASPGLLEEVQRVLNDTGLSGEQLELEVTESCMLSNLEHAQATLKHLKQMNISVAMDDFGTGYSSLAYLCALEVDVLKIDRQFVANMLRSEKDAAIARAIIELGRSLGMTIVAEGVETVEQLRWLRQNGCNTHQGFLFARALPALEVEQFVVDPGLCAAASTPTGSG